jgi:hypothetical protein
MKRRMKTSITVYGSFDAREQIVSIDGCRYPWATKLVETMEKITLLGEENDEEGRSG